MHFKGCHAGTDAPEILPSVRLLLGYDVHELGGEGLRRKGGGDCGTVRFDFSAELFRYERVLVRCSVFRNLVYSPHTSLSETRDLIVEYDLL